MSKTYAGRDTNVVSDGGGAVRVTIASNVGQGNGGTSIPCRKVLITQPFGPSANARVNIGSAASATLGIDVPKGSSSPALGPQNFKSLELSISDVNLLYFYNNVNGSTIDIVYLK